ncbi:MAG: hypothetical protein WBD31_09325 [Rubripirellula sp.]
MKTPSFEPVQQSRMLPRVSFRWMFGLMTLGAVFAAIAKAAGNGAAVAMALMMAFGFIVACFAMFAILFLISWCISSLWYQPKDDTLQGSPFSADQLPPQILPPRENRS